MDPRALARQLGHAIKETSEYQAVQAARTKVNEHEAARVMLDDFQKRQKEYGQALIKGKEDEGQAEELRKLAEIVGYNPYLRELLSAETRLAELVMSVQRQMLEAAGLAELAAEEELETDEKNG